MKTVLRMRAVVVEVRDPVRIGNRDVWHTVDGEPVCSIGPDSTGSGFGIVLPGRTDWRPTIDEAWAVVDSYLSEDK